MEQYIWVDRKFEFNLPAWMFPNLVERVRGCPVRAAEIVRGIEPSLLINRVEGKWSIQEHIGHLFDLESLWARRLDELIAGEQYLTAWDGINQATEEAKHNSKHLAEILDSFGKKRFALVSRLEQLDDSIIERTALHPRLQKPMRTIDLVYFVAEHDDHHLAQITRLKKR